MELRFVDKGTPLSIELLTREMEPLSDEKFTGKFYDMEKSLTFYITSDKLLEKFDDHDPSGYLKITFQRGSKAYTFTGKLNSIARKFRDNLILITATSPLESVEFRNAPRVEISLNVNIHKIAPDAPDKVGELLMKGCSHDISSTGICVLSDITIEKKDGDEFIVTFSIIRSRVFSLRVKLMRSGNSPVTSYKYAHGFVFEYDDNSDEKSALAISMFKYKATFYQPRSGR